MELVGSIVEKLRPLVGSNAWDYCIFWRISQDQKLLEWGGCCCKGADQCNGGGQEQFFPEVSGSDALPCRDFGLQHPRTRVCDILGSSPSVLLLESSGIHAEALISNQPRWLFLAGSPDSMDLRNSGGITKVLVPVGGGLVELFSGRQEPEDQNTVDFIVSQCMMYQQQEEVAPTSTFLNYLVKNNSATTTMDCNASHQWPPPPTPSSENPNFAWVDLSLDPFEGSAESIQYSEKAPMPGMDNVVLPADMGVVVPGEAHNEQQEKEAMMKREMMMAMGEGRADSGGSDGSNVQGEDDEDQQKVGRSGRKLHSKNLLAERKRRKKLNDRLFALRSLVPIITKMDRASILGDAIEFVKKLQSQVQELQEELEKTVPEDDDEEKQLGGNGDDGNENNNNNDEDVRVIANQIGQEDSIRGMGCSSMTRLMDPTPKQSHKTQLCDHDGGQHQMEVQVEVFQVSRNEFFVKVFCEHKAGGFVRLMEAMDALGLEVTNANVTTFRPLVLSVFKVEKRDNEAVEADQVRDSLIQLTRDSHVEWADAERDLEGAAECQQIYGNHHQHLTSHHHLHYLHNQL